MKLQATNGIPVLLEYAFALCPTNTWPFPSAMDQNILPEACLAYDTLADSENLLEDPANTQPDNKAGSSKKHCKRKGKSKTGSKSAGAASSTSETSPVQKGPKPPIREELVAQVNQDLHLSSEDLEEPRQDPPANEDLLPTADTTWIESGANLLKTPAPDLTMPTQQPGIDLCKGENAASTQEDDVDSTLIQPVTLVAQPGIPNPAAATTPTSLAVSGGDSSANLVPSGSKVPPGLPTVARTPDSDAAEPATLNMEVLVADQAMADLAQILAVAQAGGNPQAGAFSSVMTRLWEACGLMFQGFQEACLGVEVIVQNTLLEATAKDRAFTAKAAKDLGLWTSALQPLFDTDNISEADMEARRAHARHTGQVVSDQILGRTRQTNQSHLQDRGPVRAAILESFARVEEKCASTWEAVANRVQEILAQHILESQICVFLAALYQLMCTQQQGITSMVIAQAGVPVHLWVHSWAVQSAMTQLFTQVIPGLGSLMRRHWFQPSHSFHGCPSTTDNDPDGTSTVYRHSTRWEYDDGNRVISQKAS